MGELPVVNLPAEDFLEGGFFCGHFSGEIHWGQNFWEIVVYYEKMYYQNCILILILMLIMPDMSLQQRSG